MSTLIDFFLNFTDIILHLDVHLSAMVAMFGPWFYLIIFLIIFCETGLVITPFLPGDSLLFALGAIASIADSNLNVAYVCALIPIAAIIGDLVNYTIGFHIGPKVFSSETSKLLNKKHLLETQNFYERYGSITIIIARFIPIVRTFAPFVAGIGKMKFTRFIAYSIGGGTLWSLTLVLAGFYFGNVPIVKRNFHIVIFGVIFISIVPLILSYLKTKLRKAKST